ncbi:MAG: aspartate ammonia-lyase [Clostridium perfringens]|nr:aspartate ammonia-lyase [Clostridium perfringens]
MFTEFKEKRETINLSNEDYRIESDSIGELMVPKDAYYGVQTLRAVKNFNITGLRVSKELIISLVQIKKAAAISNFTANVIDKNTEVAIIEACNEIMRGKLMNEFIVDPIQGGAGTSINMNVNEVIANRATEILGGEKGEYLVHPNDHVNTGQSTNDVIPTAGNITIIRILNSLIEKLIALHKAFSIKSEEFKDIIKMGRTQLQDAVPITLGQEFGAYREVVFRDINRIKKVLEDIKVISMGATAIGTGINASEIYEKIITENLSEIIGIRLYKAKDLVDGTQNLDKYTEVSSAIKICAVNLSKIANDLRLMSSGPRAGLGEINLPSKQNGSSIMPGKINPVIPEVINQIAFNIIGNDVTISMAVEAGQLELNAFEPVIFYNLFESIETLTRGIDTFVNNCVLGITANEERCRYFVENSVGIVTALCPYLGYKESARIAKDAIKTGRSVREIILEEKLFDESKLDEILNPRKMIHPGIIGKK